MEGMFKDAKDFCQPLKLDMSNGKCVDDMFFGCIKLKDCQLENVSKYITPQDLGLTQKQFDRFVVGDHLRKSKLQRGKVKGNRRDCGIE